MESVVNCIFYIMHKHKTFRIVIEFDLFSFKLVFKLLTDNLIYRMSNLFFINMWWILYIISIYCQLSNLLRIQHIPLAKIWRQHCCSFYSLCMNSFNCSAVLATSSRCTCASFYNKRIDCKNMQQNIFSGVYNSSWDPLLRGGGRNKK